MERIMVFGDVHLPYSDPKALACFMNAAAAFKPDTLICVGDLLDFYAVSRHDKDWRRRYSLKEELDAARPVINDLSGLAKTRIITFGNHEFRYETYIRQRAPEFDGITSVAALSGLAENNWRAIDYGDYMQYGKVLYTHDLDYTGPQFAQRALNDAQHSIIIGHVHRIGLAVDGDIRGKKRVGASFGWLGSTKLADYKHTLKAAREWAHGFGIGHMNKDGTTWFTPVPIVNGVCVVEGKVVTA